MNPDLAQFSEWVLALLPRLFLYPGGLWLLVMLLILRVSLSGTAGVRTLPYALASPRQNAATAAAWVALALMPFPAVAPLPFPADTFALAALLVLSFALSSPLARREASVSVALTLAVCAPLAGRAGLLATSGEAGLSTWLSMAAVLVGLLALALQGLLALSSDVRWLAWLGLGAQPLWTLTRAPVQGIYWVTLVYLLAIGAASILSRRPALKSNAGRIIAIVWALAGMSLLSALLMAAR